jgi:hypothetical protein
VPYRDKERRRAYNTAYQRRRRAKLHPEVRVFICPKFPFLRLGIACFDAGWLVTSQPAVINEVIGHREFMRFIFPLALARSSTATEDEDE